MRYIGIDYGEKRVGIAVSDPEGRIAFPREILENKGDAAIVRKIGKFAKQEQAGHIIIGLPVDLQGKETVTTKRVRAFVQRLKDTIVVPVEFENEMLTTRMAHRIGVKKKHVDASSAALILQSYLDKHR